MASPITPQKKGDPINGITRSLNAKWNLGLPVKEKDYSPSRLNHPVKEEQVFGLIKFLHYKNPGALQKAISTFEHEATRLEVKWKKENVPVQRSNISSYFSQRKETFIKEKRFADGSVLSDILFQSLSAAKTSSLEEGSSFSSKTPHTPLKVLVRQENRSPYDCIDDTTLACLDGDDKEVAPFGEDSEDIFTTPLSSPIHSPMISPSKGARNAHFSSKKPDLYAGQKRPLPETSRRVAAPKVSRGGENHISPCQSSGELQHESPLARSFSSTASSSFVSSLESSQKVIDTAATSFTSNDVTSTQANQQLEREAADPGFYTASTVSFSHHPFFQNPEPLFYQTPEPLPDLLLRESPFTPEKSPVYCQDFRQNYEVGRVALHCRIPAKKVPSELKTPIADYSSLWSRLKDMGTLPERSKPGAWRMAERSWSGVLLSGELTFNGPKTGSVFDFQLSPLKIEKSYRLSRQFGGDRFLVITLPPLQERDLPEYLKRKKHPKAVRSDILDWLVKTGHHILGRTWRAFFVKPLEPSSTQKMHRNKVVPGAHRVYLFATDGPDFVRPSRQKSSLHELLEWFMSARNNRDQLALKFFARLSLGTCRGYGSHMVITNGLAGVSTTIPTITFSPHQIILSDDAFSNSPRKRRINYKRNIDKKRGKNLTNDSKVMNDVSADVHTDRIN